MILLTAGPGPLVRPGRFPNVSFLDNLFSYAQVVYIENTSVLCQWCPSVDPSGSDMVGSAEFFLSVSLAPTILACAMPLVLLLNNCNSYGLLLSLREKMGHSQPLGDEKEHRQLCFRFLLDALWRN